ncbi:HAMP domain-containing protein [bacterium]|nr:HAMP domain-containing protein [bacterium]
MAQTFKRKQIYINMDLQFKYSLVLIFTMFIEMVIVGLALLYVFSQPKPDIPGANIYFIYKVVLAIILFLTLCNITVGVYLSHKVAGPLFRFVMCTRELAQGNFKIQVNLRKGDEMRELESAYNDMTDKIRSLVRQDRQKLKAIQDSLGVIGDSLAKNVGKPEKDKILEEIKDIRENTEQIMSFYIV